MESLPPSLRHLNHHQSPPTITHNGNSNPTKDKDKDQEEYDEVPIIDFQRLSHEKSKLDEACKEWGFFRLVNHGIPLTLLDQLQEQAKQIFSLSFETKQASCNGNGTERAASYFWGTPALTTSGTALTSGPQNTHLVEGFSFSLGQISLFQPQLSELESFRVLLAEYGKHLSRIATTLFESLVKSLNLNLLEPSSYLDENTGNVRVYRYPSCSDSNNVGWGINEHTDSSVLSILSQDDQVSGLEVLKDHKWVTVKPIPNTLIVNIGDMMQALSDDMYKSVFHRVKINNTKERISICYFVFPNEDVKIESSKYKPFTYNEFRAQVQKDIKETGHKVGLSRFQRNEDI
ncbi:gibberellin 2-beta-dioxygenase 6-like [Arachis stenosperma]|uniref:gibberellin 2-beta-dioxygenase 6-like n=1 Tax=Arachis stenosperma TaxID=217475 RepID=UPI0025AD3DD9|nr:gibberellin 2-beta-dioxygenase 6-like [Arachis stenosperma]